MSDSECEKCEECLQLIMKNYDDIYTITGLKPTSIVMNYDTYCRLSAYCSMLSYDIIQYLKLKELFGMRIEVDFARVLGDYTILLTVETPLSGD